MSVPLVLFSGGLDSTYLVSHLLKEEGPVDVLYVNGSQSPVKMKQELLARDKLIAKMNQYYPHKIQGQYECLDPVYIHDGKNKKWIQPNAWMQGAFKVLVPTRHEKLCIGYVNDDGAYFGMHLPKMQEQWKLMQEVGYNGTPISVVFPILHMDKLTVLENIDKRLLSDIWVCETPSDDKHCGKCKPCTLMRQVLAEYKHKHGETVWNTAKRVERDFAAENNDKNRDTYIPMSKAYLVHDENFYDDYKGSPRCVKNTTRLTEVLSTAELLTD